MALKTPTYWLEWATPVNPFPKETPRMPTSGASIGVIELFVKSALPKRVHDDMMCTAWAWTRKDPDAYDSVTPATAKPNLDYFKFPVAANSWEFIIDSFRKKVGAKEGGIEAQIEDPFTKTQVFLPLADLTPQFLSGGTPSKKDMSFVDGCEKLFKGKKLYIFASGNGSHAFIDSFMDYSEMMRWNALLGTNPDTVDQKWVKKMGDQDGGILRTTTGPNHRRVPTLVRYFFL